MYFPTCPSSSFILNMSVTESFIFPSLPYWRASPLSLSAILCLLIPQNLRDSPRTVSDIISWVPFLLLFSSLTALAASPAPGNLLEVLILGTPLVVVPWLGHHTSTAWVQSLVGKLSSHILQLEKKKKKEMQIPGPYLRSTEVRTLGMRPSNLFQQQLSRWLMLPNI